MGKAAAKKAWQQTAKQRPPLPTLLDAVTRQTAAPQWQKDGGQFIPHPATWLRQGRWEDEAPVVAAPVAYAAGGVRMRTWEETEARLKSGAVRR